MAIFMCNIFGIHSHKNDIQDEMCNVKHHQIKNEGKICTENRIGPLKCKNNTFVFKFLVFCYPYAYACIVFAHSLTLVRTLALFWFALFDCSNSRDFFFVNSFLGINVFLQYFIIILMWCCCHYGFTVIEFVPSFFSREFAPNGTIKWKAFLIQSSVILCYHLFLKFSIPIVWTFTFLSLLLIPS